MSKLHIHVFEPKALDLLLSPAPETPRADDFHLCTAAEALAQRPDADVVLDGAMFSLADPKNQQYKSARWAVLNYEALTAAGVRTGGRTSSDAQGVTFSLLGDTLVALPGDDSPEGAEVVIQTYPSIVKKGINVASASLNTDLVWRAGIGLLQSGKAFFAVAVNSMNGFVKEVLAAQKADPVVHMGYTDGGGSTRMAYRDGQWFGSSENRRVVSWILAKKL